jgi:hypothetical protein
MTVTVSKPALNLREELSALKKPSGVKGEQLLRANTTDELYNVIGRNRNLIINGGFNVWQRGTSGTVVGGPAYCAADRWKCFVNTNTTITLSRQTFTPGQREVPGNPTHYARFDWLGTGATQFFGFEQIIEGCHHGAGEFLTISFYARSELGDDMNLGVSQKFDASADVACGDTTFNLETTWKRYSYTYAMPSLAGKNIGANNGLSITFWRTGTTNSYLEVANVQVEVGTAATPFEYRPFGTELALCQRYYYRISGGGNSRHAIAGNGSLAQGFPTTFYKVSMRTTPSLSYSALSDFTVEGLLGGQATPTSITLNASNTETATLMTQSAGSGTAAAVQLFGSASGAWTAFAAEL